MLAPLTVFAFSQVATPGPANMALLSVGAGYGVRRALPFVAGVVLGKQVIIWPLGFGLLALADMVPVVFFTLKCLAAAYILWLAWRVANMRLHAGGGADVPGFVAGLIVHPLNPKAWGMVTAAFTSFVPADMPKLQATATVAVVLLLVQVVCHPLWAGAGQAIAARITGTRAERATFMALAGLTVLSVLYAFFAGGLI